LLPFQKDIHLFEQAVEEIVHHSNLKQIRKNLIFGNDVFMMKKYHTFSPAPRFVPSGFVTFALTTRIVPARFT
jgi:hypothetical protein